MLTTSTPVGTNQESPKLDDTSFTKQMQFDITRMKSLFVEYFTKLSSETVGWVAIVLMHCATIPSIITLILGISDRLPPLDVVMFIWTGLTLFFIRALINKDMLNIITIGAGFIVQACLLGFLIFK